ncbi:MAG: carbonic anhydrase [Sumerlaeia bacterium]
MKSVSPEAALERLKAGNARYVDGESEWEGLETEQIAAHKAGQNPYAIVLSCADSRVPVEHVFDAGVGEVFVLRVAGNVKTEENMGSAEYAILALETPLLLVMGHESCGAVKGALGVEEGQYPQPLQSLLMGIAEGLPEGASLPGAVRANVERQVALIRSNDVVSKAEAAGTLKVVGAVYDFDTGNVEFL